MGRNGPGLFISFEGGEGGGKSTQIALLAEHLEGQGRDVILTREPGGTPSAERLRDLLLDARVDLDAMEQLLLFYAARHNHVENVIRPAVTAGKVVLCDRFSDSTAAYQGAAGGISGDVITEIHHMVLGDFGPDLTFLLDLPVAQGFARIRQRGGDSDRFEGQAQAFHERLRQAFLSQAEAAPERFRVIDASRALADVQTAITAEMDARWPA